MNQLKKTVFDFVSLFYFFKQRFSLWFGCGGVPPERRVCVLMTLVPNAQSALNRPGSVRETMPAGRMVIGLFIAYILQGAPDVNPLSGLPAFSFTRVHKQRVCAQSLACQRFASRSEKQSVHAATDPLRQSLVS